MKLRTKLSLSMGLLMVMLCGLGIFSLYQMNNINDASTEISKNWMPSTVNAQRLNTLTSDYRIQEILHIYSTDKQDMAFYVKRMDDILAQFNQASAQCSKLLSSPEEQKLYDEFLVAWKEYMAAHDEIYKLSVQNQTAQAVDILTHRSRELFEKASGILLQLVKLNLQGGDQASLAGDEMYDSSKMLVTAVLIVAVLIGVLLIFFLVRNVLRQLGKDPGELNGIARRVVDGDYNVDDGSKKMGVYGAIVEMVNALKTHIENAQRESENAREQSRKAQEAMQQAEAASREAQSKTEAMLVAADKLEQVGGVVSSASTELSAQIEQSDRGAAESAQRLSEAATAMNEMNATVQEVAKNAGSASTASAETKQKAEAGAQVVEKAVHSIEQVHQMSLELKDDMAQLNEHAQDITRIMNVISDIADQTNLLALNAAIEAARAGEAGRGFAVVADEVRKLAEKTMASTNDVGNAIKAIQESTAKSMTGVEQSVARIGEATELASQSGAALQEIVATVEATADQVNAIATASEEQSAASEEINQSIVQVNDMSRQTAEAMAEAAKAVSDLAAQAQGLTDLIQELKEA
ncbi:methyl-accepting chemotaxis protein [Desulfovibrio sp.]|uniref:methyl-accepting chemotaxis protein n=1 Tax=Desulfovibrio sp. TaxID=885 RepID=UPI0025C3FD01|nr:methyl-accepting chemotaxis protein [Desulfovibrio sp.]